MRIVAGSPEGSRKELSVMRIDNFGVLQQMYGVNSKPVKTQTTRTGGFSDSLQISDSGNDYQVAKKAMTSASDIRADRVAGLKEQIQNGTYDVSPEQFAERILEKYQAMPE